MNPLKFLKKMGSLFFLLFLFLCDCAKLYNSSSSDASLYGTSITGSVKFMAARTIITGTKCNTCHGAWGSYSEADYVTNLLVSRGNPTQSKVYYRSRGNDSGIVGDMPQSGTNLTSEELAAIKDWILNM